MKFISTHKEVVFIVGVLIILAIVSAIYSKVSGPLTPCERDARIMRTIAHQRDAGVSMVTMLLGTQGMSYADATLAVSDITQAYSDTSKTPDQLAAQELASCRAAK